MRRVLRGIGRALTGSVRFVLAVLVAFWELDWRIFQRLMAWIGRLPVLRQVERWIVSLRPYPALALLLAPAVLLFPVKLMALYLIGKRKAIMGVSVILIAKVVGTALVARIFELVQPTLMQLPWFAPLYGRWTAWKQRLLNWVRVSWAWRLGRAFKRLAKRRLRRWRGQ